MNPDLFHRELWGARQLAQDMGYSVEQVDPGAGRFHVLAGDGTDVSVLVREDGFTAGSGAVYETLDALLAAEVRSHLDNLFGRVADRLRSAGAAE